jgi:hypothetical protein
MGPIDANPGWLVNVAIILAPSGQFGFAADPG